MANEEIEGIEINAITDGQERLANTVKVTGEAASLLRQAATGPTKVTLQRSATIPTTDQALWTAIRNRTDAIGFNRYNEFINRVLCLPTATDRGQAACGADTATVSLPVDFDTAGDFGEPSIKERRDKLDLRPSIYGVDAYNLLKLATQAFLIFESGVVIYPPRHITSGLPPPFLPDSPPESIPILMMEEVPGEETRRGEPITFQQVKEDLKNYLVDEKVLPYLDRILTALVGLNGGNPRRKQVLAYCDGVLRNRLTCPSLLELIWSYWHEEGMLVQTMNAIALRFQNRRMGARDPLANLEIDPLRPLNNLLWGFIQDEYNRLSVPRRAYEYDHHYGLTLLGKAVPTLESADSRSKFIEAFHNLLYRAWVFYQEDADTTVIADGFPLLNALKEVHLLLAEGAHNQFGDLPWTARGEMLIMQWLLARQEIKEFLRGRAMVPYQEPWMAQVDTMKKLQGWTDITITHFRNLGAFGEQILLSIRYGDWIEINDAEHAKNWARYWKPEVQGYIHPYHASTGVDLAVDITDTRRAADRYLQPSVHLRNRLAAQRAKGVLPAPSAPSRVLPSEVMDYAELPAAPRNRLLRHRKDD